MTNVRHFLDIHHFEGDALRALLKRGLDFKNGCVENPQPLVGKTLAMIFEKPSTRTRVSFQVGMQKLGGEVVILSESESQLGRGETISDTARVLSRYVDAIMIRTNAPSKLTDLATYAEVPVINGLTDDSHPCQIMADIMTYEEHRGPIQGRAVAWTGDGNNVTASWVHAAVKFGFSMRIATPRAFRPSDSLIEWAHGNGGDIILTENPEDAVRGADCVVTDAWVSMGQGDADKRHRLLESYRVDEDLMALAKSDAVFMHCLPAHRGEEVTDAVMDGPQSVVWDEAENRMHAQMGILAWCMES